MSKSSPSGRQKIGRNPLQKLNQRQSSEHLQSDAFSSTNHEGWPLLKKVKDLEIQFDWKQFYDQAVPEHLKRLTEKLLSFKA